MIVNVPNVGIIPEFAQDNPTLAAAATDFSQLYNSDLAAGLAALDPTLAAGTSLHGFDLYDFNANVLANAGFYGFTNTTDRCFTNTPLSAATAPQSPCGVDGAEHRRLRLLGRDPPDRERAGPLGARDGGTPFRSPRPGRCCSSASPQWVSRDTQARERQSRLRSDGTCAASRRGLRSVLRPRSISCLLWPAARRSRGHLWPISTIASAIRTWSSPRPIR